MTSLNYDFNAQSLGSLGLTPQMTNMGMLEFHLNQIGINEGKSSLILGLQDFKMPEARKVSSATVDYLFGSVNYPAKVDKVGNLTCSFVDYINGRQRRVLHKWFDLIFNEETGLGAPLASCKCDAVAVLFDRSGAIRMQYELHGVFPTSDPSFPAVDYGNAGLVKIDASFSVDWYKEKFSDIVEVATIGRQVFQGTTN